MACKHKDKNLIKLILYSFVSICYLFRASLFLDKSGHTYRYYTELLHRIKVNRIFPKGVSEVVIEICPAEVRGNEGSPFSLLC